VAIAHDTATRFPTTDGTSGTNSQDTTTGDRTFSHAASASATGAVVILISSVQPTAVVDGVLYGGVSMTLVASAVDTSEAGAVWVYAVVGNPIPQGTQTVTLQNCTASAKWATCCTVTGVNPRVDGTNFKNTTTSTNPQVNITNAATAMAYAGVCDGDSAPATAGITGCTIVRSNDVGTRMANVVRWTSPTAAGTTAIGATVAASEDHCVAAVALSESTAEAPPPVTAHRQLRAA